MKSQSTHLPNGELWGVRQNYPNIRKALNGAVKEYKKLMKKGMFAFLD